jgi:hypothetical protein
LLGASLGGLSESAVLNAMKSYLEQVNDRVDIEIWYFDPTAKDDFYDEFKNAFNELSDLEIKNQSGLGISSINKIKEALSLPKINSIGALLSVKGIGQVSIEKSFNFINNKKRSAENLCLF